MAVIIRKSHCWLQRARSSSSSTSHMREIRRGNEESIRKYEGEEDLLARRGFCQKINLTLDLGVEKCRGVLTLLEDSYFKAGAIGIATGHCSLGRARSCGFTRLGAAREQIFLTNLLESNYRRWRRRRRQASSFSRSFVLFSAAAAAAAVECFHPAHDQHKRVLEISLPWPCNMATVSAGFGSQIWHEERRAKCKHSHFNVSRSLIESNQCLPD